MPQSDNDVYAIRQHIARLFGVIYIDVVLVDYEQRIFKITKPVSCPNLPKGVRYTDGLIELTEEYMHSIIEEPQMSLSYARQQQLDNAVKDFIEGLPDPRLLEFINNTEDTEVADLPDPKLVEIHKARDTAKNMLKYEMSYMSPLHTNVAGGKQSHITRDYTLIPQEALASLARVMYNGALKYSKDNWKLIHKRDHLNHALNHINLYLAGNVSEDHLAHAATRMMMALELDLTEENDDA